MKRILQIANTIALVITVIFNYLASSGTLSGQTMGDISAQYPTLVTPAAYAFSIWGFIYIGLALFVAYQARSLVKSVDVHDDFILQIGWWFVISCIANTLWVICWVFNYVTLSVVMMIVLLSALLTIVVCTNMERWDAPCPKIFFLWWPFCLYSGWVTVAIIANIAAWLTKIGWSGWGLTNVTWAVFMIGAAGVINVYMVWSRNMREFAMTGCWALVGIAVAQWGAEPAVVSTALVAATVMFLNASIHGYQNQETAPDVKWKQMKAEGKGLFD